MGGAVAGGDPRLAGSDQAIEGVALPQVIPGPLGVQVGSFNFQVNIYGNQTWSGLPGKPPLAGSPYRGLGAFEESDAGVFFGREAAARKVLGRLSGSAAGSGLVVLSGASGAGKSSLLRAGVLPRLRRDGLDGVPGSAQWPCLLLTPGSEPLEELAVQAAVLAGIEAGAVARSLAADPAGFALTARQVALARPGGGAGSPSARLLLVVDQFEQLFTACEQEEQRKAFIVALHAAASTARSSHPVPPALVVLGVRSDFEDRCADYPELADAIQDRYRLPALTPRQLRLAITGPAAAVGSRVQPDLTDALLDEINARAPATPGGRPASGVLPLLSHVLDQAWRNRAGDSLTLADYEATGGIETAVARSAQEAFDQLTPAQQVVARQVFLQLTAVGPDSTETSVPASIGRLAVGAPGAAGGDITAVLDAFTDRRLLTMAADTVEITHEVLLTAWPLLRDIWLAGTRADRIIRSGLSGAAADWSRHSRDPAYLYTGSLLEAADAIAAQAGNDPVRHPPLTPDEQAFLSVSRHARRRRASRLQTLVAVLSTLTVALAAITVLAIGQRDNADGASAQAISAGEVAASGELAAESQATGDNDPVLARLESVAAWRLHQTPQAEYAMLKAAELPGIAILNTGGAEVASVAFSPDGRMLADADDGRVQLWNTAVRQLLPTRGSTFSADSVAFSTDGAMLAVGGSGANGDGAVQLWDTVTRQLIATLPVGGAVAIGAVAFRPDASTLAVVTGGAVELWDTDTRQLIGALPISLTQAPESVAFSPHGTTLAVGFGPSRADELDASIELWDTGARRLVATLAGGGGQIRSMAFSHDGGTLAAAAMTSGIQLWDMANRRLTNTLAAGPEVDSVAFSPDGSLAAGTDTGTVQLWDASSGQLTTTFTAGSKVDSVAFAPDGTTLADGNGVGSIRLWDTAAESVVTSPPAALPSSAGGEIAFSPDGKSLASLDAVALQLWDTATRRLTGTLTPSDSSSSFESVAFSPNGKFLAINSQDGQDNDAVQLWDRATNQVTATYPAGSLFDAMMAFSPNGRILAVGSVFGAVELWDTVTGALVRTLPAADNSPTAASVAFSPDGKIVAVGNAAGLHLWDAATGRSAGSLPVGDAADAVAFSPDGAMLAVGTGDGVIQLWDMATGRLTTTLLASSPGSIGSVLFNPKGEVLSVYVGSGEVELWSLATDQKLGALDAGQGDGQSGQSSQAFSPGGTVLAAGDENLTVDLWSLPYLADPAAYLCGQAREAFPPAQWTRAAPGVPYQNTCPAGS